MLRVLFTKSSMAFCFVDRASRCIHLKENQLDAQFNCSIFRQTPLHVSGLSIVHHQEVHRMATTFGTYCAVALAGFQYSQDNRQTSKKNNKCQLL